LDGEEERRDIEKGIKVTLYVQVKNACIGEEVTLHFNNTSSVDEPKSYIGKVNRNNLIIIDNFEL